MSERPISAAHQAMFQSFAVPDPHAAGVYNFLMELYPAFAKKVFEGTDFITRLVKSGLSPTDILDYHICGRCEALAPLNGFARKNGKYVSKCTCMKDGCGHTTIDPITFRDWIREELRHKAPPDVAETADLAVNQVAMSMMRKAQNDLKSAALMKSQQDKVKLGIVLPNGMTHEVPAAKISMGLPVMTHDEFMKTIGD